MENILSKIEEMIKSEKREVGQLSGLVENGYITQDFKQGRTEGSDFCIYQLKRIKKMLEETKTK